MFFCKYKSYVGERSDAYDAIVFFGGGVKSRWTFLCDKEEGRVVLSLFVFLVEK